VIGTSYISEAITAYRAGALRSALISTWTAVAYDIIAKIRELAGQGDPDAAAFVRDLDDAIAQQARGDAAAIPRLLKIENDLLDKALTKFEFLSRQEYVDLSRLKDDRNLCAHPAFTGEDLLFQPSPELVRGHIVHAITHLLQQPPVQGKNALARLKQDLLQPSFPKDQAGVSAFMEHKYLNHIKGALLTNFITVFLKILLKKSEPDLKGKEDSVLRCLAAVRQHSPALYDATMAGQLPKLAEDLTDVQLRRVIRLFGMDQRCWSWLSRPLQLRLQTVVKDYAYDEDGTRDYLFEGLVISELRPLLLAAERRDRGRKPDPAPGRFLHPGAHRADHGRHRRELPDLRRPRNPNPSRGALPADVAHSCVHGRVLGADGPMLGRKACAILRPRGGDEGGGYDASAATREVRRRLTGITRAVYLPILFRNLHRESRLLSMPG
jgi:hypothetical protein